MSFSKRVSEPLQIWRKATIIKFTLLLSLTLSAYAPSAPIEIEILPAPMMQKQPPRSPTTTTSQDELAADLFDQSAKEWIAFAQDSTRSEVSQPPVGGLQLVACLHHPLM